MTKSNRVATNFSGLFVVMHISLSQIKEHLKESGHKDSRLKNLVLEMIYQSPKHLAAPEILDNLHQQDISANKTSIYRILDLLMQEDIIYEINLLDGKKRYAIKQGPEHPHLICERCGKVTCLRASQIVHNIQEQVQQAYDFELKNHGIQFFGLCQKCR